MYLPNFGQEITSDRTEFSCSYWLSPPVNNTLSAILTVQPPEVAFLSRCRRRCINGPWFTWPNTQSHVPLRNNMKPMACLFFVCLCSFSVSIKTLTQRLFTSYICVSLRWEEEYTMRMDLQQKIADLQEVTLCRPLCECV